MIVINMTQEFLKCILQSFIHKIQEFLTNIAINRQTRIIIKEFFFLPSPPHCFWVGSVSPTSYYLSRMYILLSPHSLCFSFSLSLSLCLSFNFSFSLHWNTKHVHFVSRIIMISVKQEQNHFNVHWLLTIISVKLVATSLSVGNPGARSCNMKVKFF